MTDSIVERRARAICHSSAVAIGSWNELPEFASEDYRAQARATLEADKAAGLKVMERPLSAKGLEGFVSDEQQWWNAAPPWPGAKR